MSHKYTMEVKNGKAQCSDGYHTFDELYEHRCLLFINLCLMMPDKAVIGPTFDGWFVLFLELPSGQISYHLPKAMLRFVIRSIPVDLTHKWDGHTASDVVDRLARHASRHL